MTRQDLAIVGGEAVVGGDIVRAEHRRQRRPRDDADQRADRRRRDDRRPRPAGDAGRRRRALPRFHGYGWETYEGATRGAVAGRRHHDRRHAARQAADADRRRAARPSSRRSPAHCHVDYASVRRLPRRGSRRDGARWPSSGSSRFKLFTGGVAPPGMYPGVDDGQLLDALRRAAALGRPRHRPLRERPDRRLGDQPADGRGPDRHRRLGRRAPVVQRGGGRAERGVDRRGHRRAGGDRARQLAADGRGASPRSARRGGDVWAETCHHYLCTTKEDAIADPRLKWNPPTPGPRDGGVAVAAGRRGTRAQRRQRPCAAAQGPRPRCVDAVAGRGQRSRSCSFRCSPPGRVHDHGLPIDAGRRAGVDDARRSCSGFTRARARSRSAPTPTSRSCRPTGAACSTPSELEYHDQAEVVAVRRDGAARLPEYTVLRGKLVYAEGAVTGSPGDGRHLTAETPVAA